MNVPEDLQQFVGEQLLLGNYESVDEIITEALSVLREKQRAELIEAIEIGRRQIENGECIHLKNEAEIREFFEGIKRRKPATSAEPKT
jgi:Arc/MetJ-type ribon-helix-helix transcriptional regulator